MKNIDMFALSLCAPEKNAKSSVTVTVNDIPLNTSDTDLAELIFHKDETMRKEARKLWRLRHEETKTFDEPRQRIAHANAYSDNN